MLTPDLLALRLLKSVIYTEDAVKLLSESCVDEECFTEPVSTSIYKEVLSFYSTYSKMVAESHLMDKYGVEFPEEIEPLPFLITQVLDRKMAKHLTKVMSDVAKAIESKEVSKALSILSSSSASSVIRVLPTEGSSIAVDAKKRFDSYVSLATSGKTVVFETPWPSITEIIGGWVDGTLNAVLGRPNAGKTYMSCVIGLEAARLGKKVLLATMEMPTSAVTRRIDCIHYGLPLPAVRNATLDADKVSEWEKSITTKPLVGDILVVDKKTIRTVADIHRMCLSGDYDIVIIDGSYRLEAAESRRAKWEGYAEVVNDLQRYAEFTNIPWVVTSQLNDVDESAKGKRVRMGPPIDLEDAKYCREYAINPDTVIGMYATVADRELKQMHLYMLKVREGSFEDIPEKGKITLNWNLSKWDFSELVMGAPPTGLGVGKVSGVLPTVSSAAEVELFV